MEKTPFITWTNYVSLYFLNAKDFDFVIFDEDCNSHAIQVSKQSWKTKCNKKQAFYSSNVPKYKYLLTTQTPDDLSLRKELSKPSDFKSAMTEYDLRVIVSNFINQEELFQKPFITL